jgi:spore photoproduct lyase
MIIYLEKNAKKYIVTQKILEKFKDLQIIEIDNYKNIFDKNTGDFPALKSIIIAKLS